MDQGHIRVLPERLDDLLGLVLAQEPVVHEDARQVVADRPVDEHRGGGQSTPPESPQMAFGVAYLLLILSTASLMMFTGVTRLALAGLEGGVLEYLQPVLRVAHLGWN